jgi:integrase
MAKIRKRRDRGCWEVDFVDAAGVRHRPLVETRQEAEELLARVIAEVRKGKAAKPTALTVAEYAEIWLTRASRDLKPRTIKSYRQLLDLHIIPTLGNRRMVDVQRRDVRDLLDEKHEAGLGKNTVRLIRATLSAMFNQAVNVDEIVATNLAMLGRTQRGRKAADARQEVMRPLSEEEMFRFLRVAMLDPDYGTFFLLLARTGLRPGEAAALQWSDVNFARRELLVERNLSMGQISTTKTGQVRTVDLSRQSAEELAKLYRLRERQALERGWREVPEYVFVNSAGKFLDEHRMRKVFRKLMRRAGISGHRVYDLRHTFATTLLAHGRPLTYVAAQLGHSKPTTTLAWYSRWLPTADKSYVDSLDQNFLEPEVGTKGESETAESEKTLDLTGGPSETRTPDPLIKSCTGYFPPMFSEY